MKNIKDLRNSLISTYDRIEKDEIGINKANAQANVAGKILKSIQIEQEECKLNGINKKIDFLKY